VETGRSERGAALAIAVVVLGVMMSAIDTTIVILALPDIMRELGASLIEMIWVILIYLLIVTVLATQVGRIGDKYGRTRFYNIGFLVFTVGSALCGLSPSGPALIAFRGVQALGGAFISSNSGAVIADYFPPEQEGYRVRIHEHRVERGRDPGDNPGRRDNDVRGLEVHLLHQRPRRSIRRRRGIPLHGGEVAEAREEARRGGRRPPGAGLALALLGLTMGAGYGLRGIPLYSLAAGAAVMGAFALWEVRAPTT
jgi:Arabinose efflux permease